jgi:hypothetical protein
MSEWGSGATPYPIQSGSDCGREWCGNGKRFETLEAAREYGADLAWRWTLVREWRVVELA